MSTPPTTLPGAVELLDRSLAFTRVALGEVGAGHLALPTPCHGWPVGRLLAHLDDSLDAYTEAATGRVGLAPAAGPPLESIQAKACALLGWWLAPPPDPVPIGDRVLGGTVLATAAAVEIAVHGWDLQRAVGAPGDPAAEIPGDLAAALLPAAVRLDAAGGLPDCLSGPATATTPTGAPASRLLLGLTGRS